MQHNLYFLKLKTELNMQSVLITPVHTVVILIGINWFNLIALGQL